MLENIVDHLSILGDMLLFLILQDVFDWYHKMRSFPIVVIGGRLGIVRKAMEAVSVFGTPLEVFWRVWEGRSCSSIGGRGVLTCLRSWTKAWSRMLPASIKTRAICMNSKLEWSWWEYSTPLTFLIFSASSASASSYNWAMGTSMAGREGGDLVGEYCLTEAR